MSEPSSDELARLRTVERTISASAPPSGSEAHEDARAFLQRRVATLALMLALIFGMFFGWRLGSTFLFGDSPGRAYLTFQGLSVAIFLSVWRLCAGRPRSRIAIRATELGGLGCAAAAATAMSFHLSYVARPDVVLLLCLTYTLIARAVMVPSTARRTAVYGALFAPPFLISVYYLHVRGHDPSIYLPTADVRLRMTAPELARRFTIVAALWWIAASVIATATSQVIYGLRREVRDARRLGQYTLVEKLGEGGMGVVYLARHALLRRPSAIKLLLPSRHGPDSVERFEREVQQTARLSHPNTIRVYDYGRTPDHTFYYVMEYLDGASLDDVVARTGPFAPARVIHILSQVAGALREAHEIGLIHRDVKPANIFLTQQGGVPDVAKVLDFGLVKELTDVGSAATVPESAAEQTISGTPQYMAPEAISTPEQVDARTDLYALGAVGYFLLTGQHLFTGRNLVEICGHQLHSLPPPPSARASAPVPSDLEAVVLACLEKDPARRPQNAASLQAALRACRDASAWNEEDAAEWFRRHGERLRSHAREQDTRGTATIDIDLARRRERVPRERS